MEREKVLLTEEQIKRQLDFCKKVSALLEDRPNRLAKVETFGCQQNVADGQRMMGMLQEMGFGFTEDEKQADVIVINTCAIREHAEKKALSIIGQYKHIRAKNPELIIGVCGLSITTSYISFIFIKYLHKYIYNNTTNNTN